LAANISELDRYRGREAFTPTSSASTDQIEELVNELNGICRTSSLEFALKVGAVIIHNVYEGDTKAWRDRGPKVHSFRRLAEHPNLLISPGALYRCVAVFELCERLRAPTRWRRLGASHLRAVIGLPAERQEALLAVANEERWSVQVLQERAQQLKVGRSRGGRRARSPLEKNLRALDQRLRDCEGALQQLELGNSEELKKTLQLLMKLETALEHIGGVVETCRGRLRGTRI
jgi:hypothetical protein